MIPKMQLMEQTTEGTISYFLSISWSHFSPSWARSKSRLAVAMSTDVRGASVDGRCVPVRDEEVVRGGVLDQWASPIEVWETTKRGRRKRG